MRITTFPATHEAKHRYTLHMKANLYESIHESTNKKSYLDDNLIDYGEKWDN